MEKIVVGISSCLLGEKVRFDSGHKNNPFIKDKLGRYFDFRPHCPEMSIGLGTPREPIRLVEREGDIRCTGTRTAELDVTEVLRDDAEQQREWHHNLCGYIVKKDSPSCGMERVKVYKHRVAERNGAGLYTQRLMQNFPHLPVEEEGRLQDAVLRENFITRVFTYARWRAMSEQGVSWHSLTRFHARHKYLLYSHSQHRARALGKQLSHQQGDIDTFAAHYLAELMAILKIPASRSNHVNVLQHIQGYLKRQLDSSYKSELSEAIEAYRQGLLPLVVPLRLLRHHFRRHPDNYIAQSHYLQPHPEDLMLLNHL